MWGLVSHLELHESIPVGPASILNLREHAPENLQPEILLIAPPVGPTLQNLNLVVQSFDEALRHLVLGLTVGSDAVPVTNNHQGEVFVGSQSYHFNEALQFSRNRRAQPSFSRSSGF